MATVAEALRRGCVRVCYGLESPIFFSRFTLYLHIITRELTSSELYDSPPLMIKVELVWFSFRSMFKLSTSIMKHPPYEDCDLDLTSMTYVKTCNLQAILSWEEP
jgi:hypothetical protein